jgi:hypothetical protein
LFARIIKKAYKYTKSHKFLWLFGIPLISFGILYLVIKLAGSQGVWLGYAFNFVSSNYGSLSVLIVLISGVFLGSWFRSALIWSGFKLENSELISYSLALRQTLKDVWVTIIIGLIAAIVMFLVIIWVSVPIFLVFSRDLIFRAVLLGVVGAVIFLPVAFALSLVNIFAARFRIIYGLSLKGSLQSGFDLLTSCWVEATRTFVGIAVFYVIVLACSVSVLSATGLAIARYFETFSQSGFFGIIGLFSIGLGLLLFLCNAVMNSFTNIAWTLFFLENVNAQKTPKALNKVVSVPNLAKDPAISSRVRGG